MRRMKIEVAEASVAALSEYARVPIAFTVDRVLDVMSRAQSPREFVLSERRLEVPYERDYDAIAGEGPLQWERHFDLSKWALFVARLDDRIVGGAAVAFDTPGVTILEGRRDLAVLWDIRVAPDMQHRGIGSALFPEVQTWAQRHGCRQIKIETQNTTCGHVVSTSGRDASCRRFIEARILYFQKRFSCSGTRT